MSKSDQKFADQLKEVIKGFNRRLGTKMCKQLHADCPDCQVRWVIGILNKWIDLLEWDNNK